MAYCLPTHSAGPSVVIRAVLPSVLMNLRTALAESSRSFPALRVDLEHRGRPCCQIDEAAMIADFAVAKQPRQQGQCVLGKGRVDEWLLPF